MKYAYSIVIVICCSFSCIKYGHDNSPSSGRPDDVYYEGLAKVLRVETSCGDEPVLFEFMNGTWNTDFRYSHDFTDKNEFWSYSVPDSFKAVGQWLYVYYAPVENFRRENCFYNTVLPNQITFQHITPFWDLARLQVLDINSACGGMAMVKLDKYYIDAYGADRVWVVNLPDSLRVAGKRLDCYMRHAGVQEVRKCNNLAPLQQVVIRNIFPL